MNSPARLAQNPSERLLSTHHLRALAHAVANATGIWVRELPITPEKIAMGTPEE